MRFAAPHGLFRSLRGQTELWLLVVDACTCLLSGGGLLEIAVQVLRGTGNGSADMWERLSRGSGERLLTSLLGAAGWVPSGCGGHAGESCIRLQCQADIRGLITAGQLFGWGVSLSKNGRQRQVPFAHS